MLTNTIIKNWTGKSSINELTEEELEELCKKCSYSPIPFFILTLFKIKNEIHYENIKEKLYLFSNNNIVASYQIFTALKMEDKNNDNSRIEKLVLDQLEKFKNGLIKNNNLEFENIPFVKDYFESQGIKIIEQDDKLSIQLKSFTQWLKIVNNQKKKEIKITEEQEKNIVALSEQANRILAIETESMATILINQGKKNQALEIYLKLIKDFPNKSTYFAQKIEQLNIKK